MSPPATLLSATGAVRGQRRPGRQRSGNAAPPPEGQWIPGVFVSGTTGEFTALDDDERAVVLAAALEVYGADAGVRPCRRRSARQAERLTAQAVAIGARNLAAITPFYLPAGPAALIDYYRRLDAVAGKPGSSSTCMPPAAAAESPPTSSPNWRKYRPSRGQRSAANRHRLSCSMSRRCRTISRSTPEMTSSSAISSGRRHRRRFRGLQCVPAAIPRTGGRVGRR